MTDSMKFGPEWLRNLSSEGTTGSAPRYQLAEYRYGREEMLALFDKTSRAPDHLPKVQGLYVDKTQPPMALLPMTEEETRQWNRGINSDAVLRLAGKAPLGPPGGLRGRGVSVDRGRGRGRGSGGFHYTRGLSYDETGEGLKGEGGPPDRSFGRGLRTFDRSQGGERGWPERNGDTTEWNGSTSPRKEYGKDMPGGRGGGGIDNWRRQRGSVDDDDGWRRTEKWTRSNSWRDESEGGDNQGGGGMQKRSSNWGRGWAEEGLRGRGHEDDPSRRGYVDEVPEWAMENPTDTGGSFDASGAFHGGQYSDEEEDPRSRLRGEEHRSPPRLKRGSPHEGSPEEEPRRPAGLSRSQTAQGSLSDSPKPATPPQLAKSQSAAAMKSNSYDRIRAKHQNFVDKVGSGVSDKKDDERQSPEGSDSVEGQRQAKSTATTQGSRLKQSSAGGVNRQTSEEDMDRMPEVVKDSVAKLIEEEDDKWYYRDPQGVVQGPFPSSEMLEWYSTGYFQFSLLVRRERDERYVTLGELMEKCGVIPFAPGTAIPQLKMDQQETLGKHPPQLQQQQQQQPTAPQPPDVGLQQYHQYQLLQKQMMMNQQMTLSKMTQSDVFNALTPSQQSHVLMQRAALQHIGQPLSLEQVMLLNKTNPLNQLASQLGLDQSKLLPSVTDTAPGLPGVPGVPSDPFGQLLHQVSGAGHGMVPPPLNSVLGGGVPGEVNKPEEVLQTLLRQLCSQPPKSNPLPPPPVDSLWGTTGRPQSWAPGTVLPSASQMPLWGEMKTEQQILVEQQQQQQQQQQLQQQLKLEEEQRKEQEMRRKLEEEKQELELKRREEKAAAARAKEELRKLEEERKLQKEKEERKKAEELARKKQEEAIRKKQEEQKRLEDAQKKKEEKERRKEEEREKKRLLEEEKKRAEDERIRKEEELAIKRAEEEDAARREDLYRREVEALKQLKDQNMKTRMAPWSQRTVENSLSGTSLADIQKLQEKEKKQQQLVREQQQLMQQVAHQNELAQIQREVESRSNGLNLKWAEQAQRANHTVKSLAEIQAEEQMMLARQLEKERQERAQQPREAAGSIWSSSSQTLTWANNNTATSGGGGGNSTVASPWGTTPATNPTPLYSIWETPSQQSPVKTNKQPSGHNKGSKPKSKKEEAAVLKLFEPQGDDFTRWCNTTLQTLQSEIDVPTFVTFLREIESPYDVKDYVVQYLGEGKEAQEFAKQFLERRSRWRSAQKRTEEDDMCAPAHAINPPVSQLQQEFQEVKGKKNKKGKMLKVDNRILGFSVTAAPDRINMGGRDYVDHNV